MAHDEGVARRIRECLEENRGVAERRIPGGPAFAGSLPEK